MKKSIVGAGIAAMLFSGGAISSGYTADKDITLPQPKETLNVDVMQAFRQRKSIRSFVQGKTIAMEDLATILWAGYGVNRQDGKHTVATARGKDCLDLYVLTDSGIYSYMPKTHSLTQVSKDNIKNKIARQDFVADASAVVVLVGKLDAFAGSPEQTQIAYLNYTAGAASENIFLAADSLSLGTVVMANYDTEIVKKALQLKDTQSPLYIMPIGYPK
jgi:SagB-type dehydrogenase family enzyme